LVFKLLFKCAVPLHKYVVISAAVKCNNKDSKIL
jgi:hypothetical protein